jgi:hypothetical protein
MEIDLDLKGRNWLRNGHESEGVFRGFCKLPKTPFSSLETEGCANRVNLQKLAMYRRLKLISGNSQKCHFSQLLQQDARVELINGN